MDYCRTITHVTQQGDTFYRLAQRYHTTVPDIIMRNPGLNPYNLQVGTQLRICPGYQNDTRHPEEMDLNNDMRDVWGRHNFWTAMLIMSLLNDLENTDAVERRLMQTPSDITAVFEKFFTQPMTNQLRQLLAEHVQLAGELANAINNQNMDQATQIENQLNQNADQIARALANANSEYDYEELKRMLRMHLKLMRDSMTAEKSGNHDETVRLIDENQSHLMDMADTLTDGLVQQFYRR